MSKWQRLTEGHQAAGAVLGADEDDLVFEAAAAEHALNASAVNGSSSFSVQTGTDAAQTAEVFITHTIPDLMRLHCFLCGAKH